jgi:hypothetical protein
MFYYCLKLKGIGKDCGRKARGDKVTKVTKEEKRGIRDGAKGIIPC